MPQQDKLGSGWMVIAAAVFALMGALVKKAGSDFGFGFNELVFWRTAFGLVVLGGLALLRRQDFRTPHWHAHLSRGVAGTLGLMLFFYAIAHLPLATAVTLNYTSSLFLALLSFLFLKEKIVPNMLAGLFLGFIGIVILLRPTFAAGQEWAGLIGLCAGLAAGWAYLQVRELSLLGEPGWRVVFYFCLVATVLSGALVTWEGWHPVSSDALPYLLGIGITATVAQLCLTRAYQVGRKFTVASLSYLTVVFSTLLGVWWLGDQIGWQEIAGMAVIIAAGIIGSLVKKTS